MRRISHLRVFFGLPMVGLLLCLSFVAFAGTASAQTRASVVPTQTSPTVAVKPSTVKADANGCVTLRIVGSGFIPGDTVDLFVDSFDNFLGTVTVSSSGTFFTHVTTCAVTPGTNEIGAFDFTANQQAFALFTVV